MATKVGGGEQEVGKAGERAKREERGWAEEGVRGQEVGDKVVVGLVGEVGEKVVVDWEGEVGEREAVG